jgi:lysylphosphatidylglycerol synthetase-like protein (DUF2156 family)
MQAPRDAAGSEPSPGLARKGSISRVGFWLALVTAGLTVVTFALALTAIPNDVPYPFANDEIARQWPRDYLWMYAAMPLMLLFVALTGVVHALAPQARQPYSLISL